LLTGEITGVEALVRWQHPELGLLAPLKFIPLAEETGMIVAIGQWVLQTACRQLSEWISHGVAPLRMAVNLSARQFRYGRLFEDVQDALSQYHLPPNLLELEVTESLVMDNPPRAVELLGRFKTLGITLSMDDFGTGYSSLANLKSFPFDHVKVDRSFVRDVVVDPHDAAISRAIIAMAHVLHLRVIAEGVETQAQMDFLREHSCDEIQGYFFARPMPATATEDFLLKFQPAVVLDKCR
jgi:EAL domain-containing protein (putative c-di-GMP-specific phosphodiesterase class I)